MASSDITRQRPILAMLPHTAATVVDRVTAHAHSETTNDTDIILPTVSAWDQAYAVLVPLPDGDLQLDCAFTPDEVRDYYIEKVANADYTGNEHRKTEIHTRWYEFIDTWAQSRDLASGTVYSYRMAVLFPVWTDGIVGEICCLAMGDDDRFLDLDRLQAVTHRLNDYDDAWRVADLDARLATIEDRSRAVICVKNLNGEPARRVVANSRDELRDAWASRDSGRIVEFERLHHVVGNYYAFASYRTVLDLGDRHVTRETARILPLGPTGKFVGELTYSIESDL